MKKFANSNKVNYGIALALFGILCFSLMSSVEGMEGAKPDKKTTKKTTNQKKIETMKVKEGITKKTED
jgi:hypothetical protein